MLLEYPFFFLAKTNQHETVGQSRRIAALPIGWKSFQIHLSSHRFSYRSIMEFQLPHLGEPKKNQRNSCVVTLKLKNYRILEYNRVVGSLVYCLVDQNPEILAFCRCRRILKSHPVWQVAASIDGRIWVPTNLMAEGVTCEYLQVPSPWRKPQLTPKNTSELLSRHRYGIR